MTAPREGEIPNSNEFKPGLVNRDFPVFAHQILKDKDGRLIRLSALHLSWIAHIQYCHERDLGAVINAPMAHGKSQIVAIGIPLFEINRDPNLRIKIISATDTLARDRVAAIRGYIDEDVDFREACPHVRPSRLDKEASRKTMWARHKLFVQRQSRSPDATIEAKGLLSSGVGGRADLLIFDDPVDEKNSRSEVGRSAVLDSYEKIWMTRLEPTGRWIMISTPYHHQDLNYHLRQNQRVCVLEQAISGDYAKIAFQVLNAPDSGHPLFKYANAA